MKMRDLKILEIKLLISELRVLNLIISAFDEKVENIFYIKKIDY